MDMGFHSILFQRTEDRPAGEPGAPAFFRDLNLDQVVRTITAGREEYQLDALFHSPLGDLDSIAYRQEVMREFERAEVSGAVRAFAARMRTCRQRLAEAGKRRDPHQQRRTFLGAVEQYCEGVVRLEEALGALELSARGIAWFRKYLAAYVRSPAFTRLVSETRRVQAGLASIQYCMHVDGRTVTVRPAEGETDYGAEVERTFERFRRGTVKDHRCRFESWPDLNHVEAQVLERVAQLFPEPFQLLAAFAAEHPGFLDPGVARFDREVQFYLAWREHVEALQRAGLPFCYPVLSATSKEVVGRETFDLALAWRLVRERAPVVCNDFLLRGQERILVVTGPNQGGKTTFARTFGQLHFLARLGCPVPGAEVSLFLCDRLFTQFEKEEDLGAGRGKLRDDLVRIRRILDEATPNSLVVLNEIFSSTTLDDAVFLSRMVMTRLSRLDLLAVCVTFLSELATFDEKCVSVVGEVDAVNPVIRTFKLERRPADGLAYALAVAEKHRVTRARIEERLGP